MITLENNREKFYQWDMGQRLVVSGYPVGIQVHFASRWDDTPYALSVETYEEKGHIYANVPNILLQKAGDLYVYIYSADGDKGQTDCRKVLKVHPRERPSDYVYTETEIRSWETVSEKVEKAIETVKNAVLEGRPVGLSKYVSISSSESGDAGKYIKFARISLTAPWQTCVGHLLFEARTASSCLNGMLFVGFRLGAEVTDDNMHELEWVALSDRRYEGCISALKVADGVYDLYFRCAAEYEQYEILGIFGEGVNRIELENSGKWIDTLAADYTSALVSWATQNSAEIEQIAQEAASLSARLDNLVANAGDSGDNAELIDIRVGADGVSYENAGTAVREQLGRIYHEFAVTPVYTVNRYIVATTGALAAITDAEVAAGTNLGYFASDYITLPCKGRATFLTLGTSSSYDKSGIAFYDAAKNYLTGSLYTVASPVTTFTGSADGQTWSRSLCLTDLEIPEDALYCRLTTSVVDGCESLRILSCDIPALWQTLGQIDRKVAQTDQKLESQVSAVKQSVFGTTPSVISSIDGSKGVFINGDNGKATEFYSSTSDYSGPLIGITDYIDCADYYNGLIIRNFGSYHNDKRGYAFYDGQKNCILSGQYTADQYPELTLNVPDSACYFRCSIDESAFESVTIEFCLKSSLLELVAESDRRIDSLCDNLLPSDELPLSVIRETPGAIEIFCNVGCIGDSLASGEAAYENTDGSVGYVDLYRHSWGQYLARATGNRYYNWSKGGLRTDTWLSSSYADECFDGAHLCEAYIIGLGQNDYNYISSQSLDAASYIGTAADVVVSDYSQNKDSFCGRYGKIIQKIKQVQPKSKLFLLTDPNSKVEESGINQAIRDLSALFDNVYLVDLYTYGRVHYTSGLIASMRRSGHFNALAYRKMAYIIATYIDWIIGHNPDEFSEVEFIGTDYVFAD